MAFLKLLLGFNRYPRPEGRGSLIFARDSLLGPQSGKAGRGPHGTVYLLHKCRSFFAQNKRLVLSLILLVSVMLIIQNQQKSTYADISPTLKKKVELTEATNKIKTGTNWQPRGWGSGEYLPTIPIIGAGAVIDFDSGEVIWSLDLKDKIAPASLTKLATVMTASDIAPENKILTVSREASEQIPTKLGLKSDERLTLREAIDASILTSANDAAETIADSLGLEIGDGTATFMQLVNDKLTKIGAHDTHFVTATGLDDPNHYSTVYDLAIIAHEAKINYPLISQIAGTDYIRLDANENHRLFDLPNWNALLGVYPGVNGLKIGYTENSGNSTIVTASREGKNLMAIVIGAKTLAEREIAASTLLNYGFSKSGIKPFEVTASDLTKRFADWQKELSFGGP